MQNFGAEGGPVNCNTYTFLQGEALSPIINNDGSSARQRTPLFRKDSYSIGEVTYHAMVGSGNSTGAYLEESENSPIVPGQPLPPRISPVTC